MEMLRVYFLNEDRSIDRIGDYRCAIQFEESRRLEVELECIREALSVLSCARVSVHVSS